MEAMTAAEAARRNEVMRYLLASAHLEGSALINEVRARVGEKHRAAPPEYCVDLAVLWEECKAARRRDTVRRALLLVAGFVCLGAAERTPGLAAIAFAVLCAIEFGASVAREIHVRRFNAESNGGGPDSASGQNVVVSGGYHPFVGAGAPLAEWSFTVDVTKPSATSPSGVPHPLDARELYEEVTLGLRHLALPGLAIEDALFVHGQDVRRDEEILPDVMTRPVSSVPGEIVRRYVGLGDPRVRHYRAARISSWGGLIMLSAFFRFTRIGHYLFVETRFFILAPLQDRFMRLDAIPPRMTLRRLLRLAGRAIIAAPFAWLASLLWLLTLSERGVEYLRGDLVKGEVRKNERFNYGAAPSLRETWASPHYSRYFQARDADMYRKVIQQRLLDGIVQALEKRGISTEDIRERQTTIQNHGVIVSGGGTLAADALAVGQEAKATARSFLSRLTPTSPIPSPARAGAGA